MMKTMMRRLPQKQQTQSQWIFSTNSIAWIMAALAVFALSVDLYMLLGPGLKVDPPVNLPLSTPRISIREQQEQAQQEPIVNRPSEYASAISKNLNTTIPIREASSSPVDTTATDTDTDDNTKERVLAVLKEAGITVTAETEQKLPTWNQVTSLYSSEPVIGGLDTCANFRDKVPAERRMLGAAGMFSTGTNLITVLLKQNCVIPARAALYGADATKEKLGMRWQVPWGKHTPARYKTQHHATHASDIAKDDILPVVTIRHPWTWMQSMCKNPYSARWSHWKKCPNLLQEDGVSWNNVTVKYGAAVESYQSLAHLWNDWYRQYVHDADYPFVMIRMEDLVFHTQSTVTQVCACAGGEIRTDRPFQYVADSAKKDSPGHDTTTGYAEAWIKYSKPLKVMAGFAEDDYEAALKALNSDLMDKFGYHHPLSSSAAAAAVP
jgi:hypothetical protein